jgi:hypothetical protein
LLIAVVLTLVVAVPMTVFAIDRFTDVPTSNTFHSSITWLADNEITLGCNPPTNDEFCPGDNVTRQQMAAFMRRLAQTFGNAGTQVTGAGDTVVIDSTTPVEVLSVVVSPKHLVNVTLNAHVVIGVGVAPLASGGSYEIHRESCSGDLISSGRWTVPDQGVAGALLDIDTFALTGSDTVSGETTYVLCVDKETAGLPDAVASQRGITASWSPDA